MDSYVFEDEVKYASMLELALELRLLVDGIDERATVKEEVERYVMRRFRASERVRVCRFPQWGTCVRTDCSFGGVLRPAGLGHRGDCVEDHASHRASHVETLVATGCRVLVTSRPKPFSWTATARTT